MVYATNSSASTKSDDDSNADEGVCKDVVDEGFSISIWTQLYVTFMTLIQLSRTDCDAIIFDAVLEFLETPIRQKAFRCMTQ